MTNAEVLVRFTENTDGFVGLEEREDCSRAYMLGLEKGASIHGQWEIAVANPRELGIAPNAVSGFILCEALGGKLTIEDGECILMAAGGVDDAPAREVHHRHWLKNAAGAEFTLFGDKVMRRDSLRNASVLSIRIFSGKLRKAEGQAIAAGELRMGALEFAQQIASTHATGADFAARLKAIHEFGRNFAGDLWEVYRPKLGTVQSHDGAERPIPLFSLEGVRDARIETHYFTTGDKLSLSMLRFHRAESNDVVVLLHGLTTSTDMFIMPEHYNLVSYLLDHGFSDVWSLDWRGSMRHSYNLFPMRFCLDDIAMYDIPAAFAKLRQVVGPGKRIHVICHCVGSITFLMSMAAGAVSGISSVISNSVSLTPRVSAWSKMKLTMAPFAMNYLLRFPNVNPNWATLPGPGIPQGKILAKLIAMAHRECNVPACAMLSFMWGNGHPGCYLHENLDPITHERIGDLFGAINVNYYLHIRKMVAAGAAVKMHPQDRRYAAMPDNYLEAAAGIDTPILFLTGRENCVFPGSNQQTFGALRDLRPDNPHEFRILDGYGHQDPFMGKRNAVDVFPLLVSFLEKNRARPVKAAVAIA